MNAARVSTGPVLTTAEHEEGHDHDEDQDGCGREHQDPTRTPMANAPYGSRHLARLPRTTAGAHDAPFSGSGQYVTEETKCHDRDILCSL